MDFVNWVRTNMQSITPIPVNNINGVLSPSGDLELRVEKPVSIEMGYKCVCVSEREREIEFYLPQNLITLTGGN